MGKEKECFVCDVIIAGETTFKASGVDKYDICGSCYNKIDKKCSTCSAALIGCEYKMSSTGKDGKIMCDDCYDEEYKYLCEFCQDLSEYDDDSYYVVSQKEIDEHDYEFDGAAMKPGIYAPIVQEYDEDDCLSMGWHEFAGGTLKIIVPVDIKGDWWNPCPRICSTCVEKYKEKNNGYKPKNSAA